MKKTLTLILTFCILTLYLVSCSGGGGDTLDVDVDLNFTGLSNDQLYDTIAYFMANPKDYSGKTVAITSRVSIDYCFSKNTVTSTGIIALDPTNCCDAYYEIRTADGKYPDLGKTATVIGTFSDSYITVDEFKKADFGTDYDFDALSMTPNELYTSINDYKKNFLESDINGKTIRIAGHYAESDGYYYLLGLDANGKTTWNIEVINPSGLTAPVQSGNYLNPVIITGVIKDYKEGGKVYPCVEIKEICKVVATLS